MRKVQIWGANRQIPRSPLAPTPYPRHGSQARLHLSSVHAGYLSIPSHISGPESYLGTAPNTPTTCLGSVATKSPYYEPSNLGPATIGIWHQIFISPLDTISVTSDRHGSPISPVHLSCSCQPATMSSRKWQKTDRAGLGQVWDGFCIWRRGWMRGGRSGGWWWWWGLRTTAALLASRDKMEYCIRTFTLSYENTNWKCFLIETACIN